MLPRTPLQLVDNFDNSMRISSQKPIDLQIKQIEVKEIELTLSNTELMKKRLD